MAKVVKVQVVDTAGKPIAGLPLKLTGCEELSTGAEGVVMFLAEEAPALTLEIGGKAVWNGPADQLKAMEVFTQTGSGFARK